MTLSPATIRRLHAIDESQIDQLAELLVATVEDGASVGFMAPMKRETALAFWAKIAGEVAAGARALLVAETGGRIVGTVQVILVQPENQPHRADIAKMQVAPSARRRGIGEALLKRAEEEARAAGKTVLVLDTASGDAERLYARGGWRRAGVVPDYALWPHGGFCDTTFFYRHLGLDGRLEIREGGLDDPRVQALIARHLAITSAQSPPESCHAFDLSALSAPEITVWAAWEGEAPLGVGALARLGDGEAEVKSMHTAAEARGRGVGGAMLAHIVAAARAEGLAHLHLETGVSHFFAPARALYERHGFTYRGPFGGYSYDPHSVYMTRDLRPA